jgi:hypothetical protein
MPLEHGLRFLGLGMGQFWFFLGEVLASFLDIGLRWFGPLGHGLVLLVYIGDGLCLGIFGEVPSFFNVGLAWLRLLRHMVEQGQCFSLGCKIPHTNEAIWIIYLLNDTNTIYKVVNDPKTRFVYTLDLSSIGVVEKPLSLSSSKDILTLHLGYSTWGYLTLIG